MLLPLLQQAVFEDLVLATGFANHPGFFGLYRKYHALFTWSDPIPASQDEQSLHSGTNPTQVLSAIPMEDPHSTHRLAGDGCELTSADEEGPVTRGASEKTPSPARIALVATRQRPRPRLETTLTGGGGGALEIKFPERRRSSSSSTSSSISPFFRHLQVYFLFTCRV